MGDTKQFFKMYGWYMEHPNDLKFTELRLLLLLAYQVEYGSNRVILGEVLPWVESKLDIRPHNIRRILKRLIKKGLIYDKGYYIILNEDFCGKGR